MKYLIIYLIVFVVHFHFGKVIVGEPSVSGDDLFSALKTSRSFSNSNLGHLWHSSDSDRLQVPETLWSTSYSEPLPAVPNTTARSLHSDPSSDTPSKDYYETSTSSEGSSETLQTPYPPIQTPLRHSSQTLQVVAETRWLLWHPILRVASLK